MIYNLNTSYVKVQQKIILQVMKLQDNLNTSYVKVQPFYLDLQYN